MFHSLQYKLMCNCPSCGSSQIQLIVERNGGNNISWTGAFAGAVIGEIVLGDAGSVVGSILGAKAFSKPIEYIELNYCLNCGNKWNAESIFQIISLISQLIGINLDLSIELHRYCLAEFVRVVIPEMSHVEKAKQDRPLIIAQAQTVTTSGGDGLNLMGTAILIIGIMAVFINWIVGIMITAFAILIYVISANMSKEYRQNKVNEAVLIANKRIEFSEQQLDDVIYEFASKYQHANSYVR